MTMPDVSFTDRLWSEECAIADASEGVDTIARRDVVYEFAGGRRKFYDPDVYPFAVPPDPPPP